MAIDYGFATPWNTLLFFLFFLKWWRHCPLQALDEREICASLYRLYLNLKYWAWSVYYLRLKVMVEPDSFILIGL